MSLLKWGFIGLLLLPAAELVAFITIASLIGWLWAICLFLATTALGLLILRRSGRRDLNRFRAALATQGIAAMHLESPGLGPMIAGILLVFPGFITDTLGLLLLIPALRRALRAAIGRARDTRRQQQNPSVIDLTPKDWHQVPDPSIEDAKRRKRAP